MPNRAGQRTCGACGEPLSAASRFCRACGAPADASRGSQRGDRDVSEQRVVLALGTGFAGTLVAVLAVAVLAPEDAPRAAVWLQHVALAAVALVSAAWLGRSSWRSTFAEPGPVAWWAVGLGAGAACFAMNAAYVLFVAWVVGGGDVELEAPPPEPFLADVLDTAVMPALVEEWLCRGVLWAACRRVLGRWSTLAATSALFALLHGLGGWGLLEIPHRFATGLVLGWLRDRSGSLVPGILGHFVNNLLAVWLARIELES